MTKLYLRHGETFNGDGTSPDAATVDGGVGAFNDYIACWNGANDSIAAVDELHIFTGGSPTVNITTSWAFTGNKMVFDAGVEFGGAFGEFTTNFVSEISMSNATIVGNRACRFTQSRAGYAAWRVDNTEISGVHFEDKHPNPNTSYHRRSDVNGSVIYDCEFTYKGWYATANTSHPLFTSSGSGSYLQMDGITINWNTTSGVLIFRGGTNRSNIKNLVFHNDNINVKVWYASGHCTHRIDGLHFDTGDVEYVLNPSVMSEQSELTANNITNGGKGFYDSVVANGRFEARTQIGYNYPYLNALSIDPEETKFSVKVRPYDIFPDYAERFLDISKLDTIGGTRDLRISMLIPDNWTNITKRDYHLTLAYVDSTGANRKYFSPINDDPMDSDASAAWSATLYTATNFIKHAINVTALDIKPNSLIHATVLTARTSLTTAEFFFVDPEIQLL